MNFKKSRLTRLTIILAAIALLTLLSFKNSVSLPNGKGNHELISAAKNTAAHALRQAEDQAVNVDVNLNIKHSVGGVSDFGRDRHITVHASITEPDWTGEQAKMDELIRDLDVYLGRDNGLATFHFKETPQDPNRPNQPDIAEMKIRGDYFKNETYAQLDPKIKQYAVKSTEMIMGTNPHPTYPTLSWYPDGFTNFNWQPKYIETSTEWVVEYLDNYFAKSDSEPGMKLPQYWEVINEPDMLMMTSNFMVTSQEKLWQYHNLVAEGVKNRLGAKAPLIGGMTWGLHDLFRFDGISRYAPDAYDQWISDPAGAAFYRQAAATQYYENRGDDWYQWDIMWKGFVDTAGANMDFYSVHFYDWPVWQGNDPVIRCGGHVEAALDTLEWYDQYKFGSRKPIIISEYGAVSNYIEKPNLDPKRRDWENLKPFSQMLLQFLERPDYLVKTMPFTPIKAEWGDWKNSAGEVTNRYPYTMMDKDANGKWQWSEYILWYKLWSDVDGTRIDTKAWDRDIQVDAYVKDDHVYLILNNLERNAKTLQLNLHGAYGNSIESVRVKHLYLDLSLGADGRPVLSDDLLSTAPVSVILGAEATMILDYDFSTFVSIPETAHEYKYYGESLSGGSEPHRKRVQDSTLTAYINAVNVPPGEAEAMLRLCGNFYWDHITQQDDRNAVTINGHDLKINPDWRGEKQGNRNNFFGVLEIPVPKSYLKTNNTITAKFLNVCDYTNVSLQVWEFSTAPGRSEGNNQPGAPKTVSAYP